MRYGQGTDYPHYEATYYSLNAKESLLVNTLYHGELGWYILMMIFRRLGCSFPVFIGFISAVMMIGTFRAINAHSPFKIFSLALLYPTYYLTYYFAALRQGLVLSLFLDIGLTLLKQKRYVLYCAFIISLALFHKSALALLLLPVALKVWKPRFHMLTLAMACVMPLALRLSMNLPYLARFQIKGYLNDSISYMGAALRLLEAYFVIRMHHAIEKNKSVSNVLQICNDKDEEREMDEAFLYRIYLVGVESFIMLSSLALISQRITMPFKAIEILLIPIQVEKVLKLLKMKRRVGLSLVKFKRGSRPMLALSCAILLIINMEMFKNINSYILQGRYEDYINVFNFPYVSVLNKDEAYKVRDIIDNIPSQ